MCIRDRLERGLPAAAVSRMMALIQSHQPGTSNLDYLDGVLGHIPEAADGIRELRELAGYLDAARIDPQNYAFDFTMVRGLGYYTGPIFETVITEPNLGSVTGGGRYDDLVGLFRKESLPTTGTSLGVERIIDLMDILGLYPPELGGTVVQALVTVFDDARRLAAVTLAADLRAAGVNVELYLQDKNLGRQFNYADKKGIPVVVVLGPEEQAAGVVRLKRLRDGQEVTAAREAAAGAVQSLLAG